MSFDYHECYLLNKKRRKDEETMDNKISINIKGSDVVKLAMCACVGWHLGEICIMATCKMLLKLGDKVFEKKEDEENV